MKLIQNPDHSIQKPKFFGTAAVAGLGSETFICGLRKSHKILSKTIPNTLCDGNSIPHTTTVASS